jgi:integrase
MPSEPNERTKAVRVTENSFYALVRAFKDSAKFRGLAEASRDLWGRELDFACRPNCLGAVPLDVIRPALIQGYLDGWDDKPGKQAAAKAAFKALERWAVVRDLLPRSITLGVETGKPEGGHVPWTDAQVALAEKHVRPDLARAITLGANTGQRTSDLVRMGPTDIETYRGIDGINVRQKKTGRQVWVPILTPLAAAMETWERRPGPFLLRMNGTPWPCGALTDRLDYEKKINPAIAEIAQADLVIHGLRGHACVRLRRAGCTAMQIADMIGMSAPMVERYCRLSVQRENAVAAVIQLRGTIAERNGENVVKIGEGA